MKKLIPFSKNCFGCFLDHFLKNLTNFLFENLDTVLIKEIISRDYFTRLTSSVSARLSTLFLYRSSTIPERQGPKFREMIPLSEALPTTGASNETASISSQDGSTRYSVTGGQSYKALYDRKLRR